MTTNGVAQARTANAQNELTQVGSSALAYSTTGNLTTDAQGRTLAYNAWNRLVSVRNATGTEVARYEFDGLNRRVVEQVGTLASPAAATAAIRDVYYSQDWQALEERVRTSPSQVATTADTRFIWSPVYVDAMVARDRNADANTTTGTGGLEQRVYALQDANWNTTAIIAASGVPGVSAGNVINRFAYTPYGESQTLTASWATPPAGSTPAVPWSHLFQGLEFTDVTGLAYVRHRDYSASLGRFIEMDPIGFSAGDNNWYRFVANGPTHSQDAYGLEALKLPNGQFDVSVTARRRRAAIDTYGVYSEIAFTPKAQEPCCDRQIKLLQVVRVRGPGRPHVENPKTKEGWMVDNVTSMYKPGKESPFYNDYVVKEFKGRDGAVTCGNKAGGPTIKSALLKDAPGFWPKTAAEEKRLADAFMEFETVAIDVISNKVLGSVTWSFTFAYDKSKRDYFAVPGPVAAQETASNTAIEALSLWNKKYGK